MYLPFIPFLKPVSPRYFVASTLQIPSAPLHFHRKPECQVKSAGYRLDLMLWYGGVIDWLFPSTQRIPPSGLSASSYWLHCCYQSVGGFAPSTILLQIPLQNPTSPSFPFREKQKRASIGSVATLP